MVLSPKVEVKLPPLEVEINHAALQGKLAYVSPTVRTIHNTAHKLSTSNTGAVLNNNSAFQQHKQRPPNLNFSARPTGPSRMSPVQTGMPLAQPVFLNTGPQMEVHRHPPTLQGSPIHHYLLPAHQQPQVAIPTGLGQYAPFSPSVPPPPAHQSPRHVQYTTHPLPAHVHPVLQSSALPPCPLPATDRLSVRQYQPHHRRYLHNVSTQPQQSQVVSVLCVAQVYRLVIFA
ncbi:hypothetical protein FSP39_008140 [Pinctada imbricata]|uniref:Uncharacterized protein n=1 Tax=Pinctada imbricata TaxID=66713 RepID=A0AA89BZ35_PINIB|nr:hypothetical protein FSP39_008140 [Pinctada imbricata]